MENNSGGPVTAMEGLAIAGLVAALAATAVAGVTHALGDLFTGIGTLA